MKDKEQQILFEEFEDLDWWKKEWQDMPEFIMGDLTAIQSINVHFETIKDRDRFAKIMDQTITSQTKYIWYPKVQISRFMNKLYVDEEE